MSKQNKKQTQECQHQWASLIAQVGKKTIPTSLFTCLECGEMKVGKHTIRISRFRLDMGALPIENLAVPTTAGDALRKGTRWTVSELPALTDEKIWKGTGGDPEEIAVPGLPGATQPINSKGNSFATIVAAVNDLAGDGWVYVPAGTYNETITISNNNVILFGAGWSTIIDGGTAGTAVTISGASCVVRDLTLKATPAGGNPYNGLITGVDCLAYNVKVDGSDEAGIHIGGVRSRVIGCYIYNADGYGINVSALNSIAIGNVINTTGDDGIWVHSGAEDCVVVGNRITGWTNEAIDDDSGTSTVANNDMT